ncbi:COP9 signalosome complex subunit 8 [Periplaneta americana]|uniref:COP9 signalosome complex subunit 8 n=1 Tax=Periplaneta americana TaxID=6978 RepID=UPI0037E9137D
MVTDTENIRKLAEDLEKQELDAPGGIPTSQVYAQLLAIYLYQNDLCNAKYLWKRIPQNVKNSHTELASIWKVGQRMWQRDFPGVYVALSADWSENVGHIMQALLENVRKRAVFLVSHAYSSISVDDLAAFVGMPVEQAVLAAAEQGWTVDTASRMVKPCRPNISQNQGASSEDQLYKLTEFVSFLEN